MDTDTRAGARPLAGVKVLELTHVVAGPYCTQLMADAGAEVIKVESLSGDLGRQVPPLRNRSDGSTISSYCAGFNRGKRVLAIDLNLSEQRNVVLGLVDAADIVVDNYSPGALKKLGIDLREARVRRPSLITVSIGLYGSHDRVGHFANRKGFALTAEGESGVTWKMRDPEASPRAFVVPFADMVAGMSAYAAAVTALFDRGRNGSGTHIDISMVQVMNSMNTLGILDAQLGDPDELRQSPAGYGIFKTQDGFVTLAAVMHIAKLFGAMGRGDLLADERYATYTAQNQHVDEINALIKDWTSKLKTADIVQMLDAIGIPVGHVRSPAEIASTPDVMPEGFLKEIDGGSGGSLHIPSNPLGFDTSAQISLVDRFGKADLFFTT